jgi:16S rRNA (cytosine967-C5)-methyltransferase
MELALYLVRSLSNPVPRTYKRANPDATRLLVFDLLTEVNRSDGYSNLLLPQALTASKFDDRDKAFATELLYGTLRMQGRHDWILAQVSNRPWEQVDPGVIDVGRMALQQIHELRVPDHAAVSASVDIARKRLGEAQGSFLNALRRAVLKKPLGECLAPLAEIKDPIERLSIQYSHPQWIVSAYFDLLKNEADVTAALIANNIPAQPTLVSWPGRSTQAELVELGGVPTQYSPYGARLSGSPGAISAIRDRRAGVQDEGSQLVAQIFAAVSKSAYDWLDLCAGPGGKAALISSIAALGDHTFTANEISGPRANLVSQVVEFGQVIVGDGREIAKSGRTYDAILADVPCTGLGALRRRPEVRWRRTLADLRTLTDLQIELSNAAIAALNPNGFFAYVTCSPHLAETKFQVSAILKAHPELEKIDLRPYFPAGLVSSNDDGSLLLWPQIHNTDAMFMTIFKKSS